MTQNGIIAMTNMVEMFENLRKAEKLFDKNFKGLQSFHSGLDYGKWSDSFYDSLIEMREVSKAVTCEIIELEVNKNADK